MLECKREDDESAIGSVVVVLVFNFILRMRGNITFQL